MFIIEPGEAKQVEALTTVGAQIPNVFGILMVKSCSDIEWFGLGTTIPKPNARPFKNQTKWPPSCILHLKTKLQNIWYWDVFGIQMVSIQAPTVLATTFAKLNLSIFGVVQNVPIPLPSRPRLNEIERP